MQASLSRSLWPRPLVLKALTGQSLAALTLVGAWLGVSGAPDPSKQLHWYALGCAALVLSGAVNTAVLLIGRRAIGHRDLPPAMSLAVRGRVPSPGLAALEGLPSYHRPDCLLVLGKDILLLDAGGHEAAGRRPCGMCQP